MGSNSEITVLVYPTVGESFDITTADFTSVDDAVMKLSEALAGKAMFRITDRNESEGDTTLVFNLTNVVAIRILIAAHGSSTGQYL